MTAVADRSNRATQASGVQAWSTRAAGSLRATVSDLGRGRVDVRDVGLRLVRPVQSRARRAPFVVVVLTVLAIGLVGLILISTTLQSLAFEQTSLNAEVATLEHQRDALERQVDRLSSPASIADEAARLGMVRNQNPAFLRLSDGEVLGKPVPAVRGQR